MLIQLLSLISSKLFYSHYLTTITKKDQKKNLCIPALAGVAQWIEPKVAGASPSQDTYLGWGPGPQ